MKDKVVHLSSVLIACGFAEFVSSVFVIYYSGGNYMGGIYVGTMAVAAGLISFLTHKKSPFGCIVLFTGLLIVTLISIVQQGLSLSYVQGIASCAAYTKERATTGRCKGAEYNCFGKNRNHDYIIAAQYCENYYSNAHGKKSELSCSCIQRDSLSCYTFTNISSCENFTLHLPNAFSASFSFAIIVGLLSIALLATSIYSYKFFQHVLAVKSTIKGSNSLSRQLAPAAVAVPMQAVKPAVVCAPTEIVKFQEKDSV